MKKDKTLSKVKKSFSNPTPVTTPFPVPKPESKVAKSKIGLGKSSKASKILKQTSKMPNKFGIGVG